MFSYLLCSGRNYDQLQNANPLVMRVLVPATLIFLRSDSLYVTTGEAVRYNCQTARLWRLRVFLAKAGIRRLPGSNDRAGNTASCKYRLHQNFIEFGMEMCYNIAEKAMPRSERGKV